LPSTFVINDWPDFRERCTAAPVAAAWCVMCDEMMAEPSAVCVVRPCSLFYGMSAREMCPTLEWFSTDGFSYPRCCWDI
jgi:hypothetical protein